MQFGVSWLPGPPICGVLGKCWRQGHLPPAHPTSQRRRRPLSLLQEPEFPLVTAQLLEKPRQLRRLACLSSSRTHSFPPQPRAPEAADVLTVLAGRDGCRRGQGRVHTCHSLFTEHLLCSGSGMSTLPVLSETASHQPIDRSGEGSSEVTQGHHYQIEDLIAKPSVQNPTVFLLKDD